MATDVHTLMSALRPRQADASEGTFGRLFPDLPKLEAGDEAIVAIGRAQGLLGAPDAGDGTNPRIAAGWTFFGQFVAHDITHDRAPLQQHEEVSLLRNFRTPRLDLEAVYAAGPIGQPYLYDTEDPDKLLVVEDAGTGLLDIPRNSQGRGVVGDARNDTHVFVSQLQLAFLGLHNHLVDDQRAAGVPADDVFQRAQSLARWHYQWLIMHEYLPLSVGEELVRDILTSGRRFYMPERPFVPVEFSDGAYRFGHAQISDRYSVNVASPDVPLFPDLLGARPVTAQRVVDWPRFFAFPDAPVPQPSRLIRPHMTHELLQLPTLLVGHVARPEVSSLAYRDLQRSRSVDMPSGEAVARVMGLTPLSTAELGFDRAGWTGETPLWLYILKEAELEHAGRYLGSVGGRIVGEVLIGLIQLDPTSFLNGQPDWKPTLPAVGAWSMDDLLTYAGVGPASPNGRVAAGRQDRQVR
jgi:hypothetical protein